MASSKVGPSPICDALTGCEFGFPPPETEKTILMASCICLGNTTNHAAAFTPPVDLVDFGTGRPYA